jgi:hypothetical protein
MTRKRPRLYPFPLLLILLGSFGGSAGLNPVWAHEIQVNQGVAATFHLEPRHQPKAQQPAQVWFALTRANRQRIPLSACICTLKVYRLTGTQPQFLLQPALKSLDVEGYRGVPSATLRFPSPGLYRLELTGKPKVSRPPGFPPFRFTYEVVVSR